MTFLENLHFLAMKRNCIVYETTKSTKSKPYNSILCHFFLFVFFVLFFFFLIYPKMSGIWLSGLKNIKSFY